MTWQTEALQKAYKRGFFHGWVLAIITVFIGAEILSVAIYWASKTLH